MIGIVRIRFSGELRRICASGCVSLAQRVRIVRPIAAVVRAIAVDIIINCHAALRKIDGHRAGVVIAAKISDTHTIDEDPNIVITGEAKSHRLAVVLAACRLLKARRHVQTKVVLDRSICRGDRAEQLPIPFAKNLLAGVERKKLSHDPAGAAGNHARRIVERKAVRRCVEYSEIVLAVVRIVAGAVLPQKTAGVNKRLFACAADAVKKIGQRFAVALFGGADIIHLRIAVVAERAFHDVRFRLRRLCPPVDIKICAVRVSAAHVLAKIQHVVFVDAHLRAVFWLSIVRRILSIQPVIEKIDGNSLRMQRLRSQRHNVIAHRRFSHCRRQQPSEQRNNDARRQHPSQPHFLVIHIPFLPGSAGQNLSP